MPALRDGDPAGHDRQRFRLPEVSLPDLDFQDAESAADALRAAWGRGEEPLPNLIQLSEAHGVRVLSLPTDASAVDAFSLWLDGLPWVFLSTVKTAERSRFDLAHELGHLVMHSRDSVSSGAAAVQSRQLEREADAFASALLMPGRDLLARSGREPAVPQILQLRDFYRVSAMAVARRLHEVGRSTDWSYRQNCVALTQRGFRSAEPGGMERERSRVFAAVFDALRARGVSSTDVCRELGIHPRELNGLTLGQVSVVVPGAGAGSATPRPALGLVREEPRRGATAANRAPVRSTSGHATPGQATPGRAPRASSPFTASPDAAGASAPKSPRP